MEKQRFNELISQSVTTEKDQKELMDFYEKSAKQNEEIALLVQNLKKKNDECDYIMRKTTEIQLEEHKKIEDFLFKIIEVLIKNGK